METEHWRRTIAEEWLAVVAVGLIVVAGGLAAAAYGWGYEPEVAYGVDVGMVAAAGLLLAGSILALDLLRDYAGAVRAS